MHFMIAEKSSDVKVKRVSRLAKSKARCCISHNFGGFYQIIPCIRPAVVACRQQLRTDSVGISHPSGNCKLVKQSTPAKNESFVTDTR